MTIDDVHLTKFKIEVSSSFTKSPPFYSICIDDAEITLDHVIDTNDQTYTTEFTHPLADGDHVIKIRVDESVGSRGMINVERISINGKDLDDYRLYLLSHYITDQPQHMDGVQTQRITQCVNLGWSGTYYLPFRTPLVLWFLENFY